MNNNDILNSYNDIVHYLANGCYNGNNSLDYNTLMVAQECISKQIPKKAAVKKEYYGAQFCPICDTYLGQFGDMDKYCPICGQLIEGNKNDY